MADSGEQPKPYVPRCRGGKSGKRQQRRIALGYVPPKREPIQRPPSPPRRAKAKPSEAIPPVGLVELPRFGRVTESSRPVPRLVPKAAPATPRFGSSEAERPWSRPSPKFEAKAARLVERAPLCPPTSKFMTEAPTEQQVKELKESFSRENIQLRLTPKFGAPTKAVLRKKAWQEVVALLDSPKLDAPTQEERIEARRALRQAVFQAAPKGTAGLDIRKAVPSICSSCVVRKARLHPLLLKRAREVVLRHKAQRQAERRSPAPDRSRVVLRSKSPSLEVTRKRGRSRTPRRKVVKTPTPSPSPARSEADFARSSPSRERETFKEGGASSSTQLPKTKKFKKKTMKDLKKAEKEVHPARSYKDVLTGVYKAKPEPEPKAMPIPKTVKRSLVTIDLHGVLDTGPNQSCTDATLSALHSWASKLSYEIVVLSFIGRNNVRLHEQARSFVADLIARLRRTYGYSCIRELQIVFSRKGTGGKGEWCRDNGSVLHIDDNLGILRDCIEKNKGIEPVWIVPSLPERIPKDVFVGTTLYEYLILRLEELTPGYDPEAKIKSLEAQWKPRRKRR